MKMIAIVLIAIYLAISAFWPVSDQPTTLKFKLGHLAAFVAISYGILAI
jgi:hypothetical protein